MGAGPGQRGSATGAGRASRPLLSRPRVLFLFSPLSSFLPLPLAPPAPCSSCTCPPARPQPTDERSWVYSPLHYSAQAQPASDGESDTVSAARPAGASQAPWRVPGCRWPRRAGPSPACLPAPLASPLPHLSLAVTSMQFLDPEPSACPPPPSKAQAAPWTEAAGCALPCHTAPGCSAHGPRAADSPCATPLPRIYCLGPSCRTVEHSDRG